MTTCSTTIDQRVLGLHSGAGPLCRILKYLYQGRSRTTAEPALSFHHLSVLVKTLPCIFFPVHVVEHERQELEPKVEMFAWGHLARAANSSMEIGGRSIAGLRLQPPTTRLRQPTKLGSRSQSSTTDLTRGIRIKGGGNDVKVGDENHSASAAATTGRSTAAAGSGASASGGSARDHHAQHSPEALHDQRPKEFAKNTPAYYLEKVRNIKPEDVDPWKMKIREQDPNDGSKPPSLYWQNVKTGEIHEGAEKPRGKGGRNMATLENLPARYAAVTTGVLALVFYFVWPNR